MTDAGDYSGGDSARDDSDIGIEAAAESSAAETELYSVEESGELYDPGYDHSEYETELMDYSYEFREDFSPSTVKEPLNDKGQPVEEVPNYRSGEYLNYEHPDYITEGDHRAYWPDKDGFESEPDPVTLPENTTFARYGNEYGRNATEVGTSPEKLSLPYDTDTMEYHEYRVVSPVECLCGKAKACFDVEGGGTQYKFEENMAKMVHDGKIERIK